MKILYDVRHDIYAMHAGGQQADGGRQMACRVQIARRGRVG